MLVTPWCCGDDIQRLERDSGITMGDVVDAARRVREEHKHCPDVLMVYSCRSVSNPRYPLLFGEVVLSDDHLGWKRAKKEAEVALAEDRERLKEYEDAGWGDIWNAFRKARRDAMRSDERWLNWPAFLAANKELAPKSWLLGQAQDSANEIVSAKAKKEEDGTSGGQ